MAKYINTNFVVIFGPQQQFRLDYLLVGKDLTIAAARGLRKEGEGKNRGIFYFSLNTKTKFVTDGKYIRTKPFFWSGFWQSLQASTTDFPAPPPRVKFLGLTVARAVSI